MIAPITRRGFVTAGAVLAAGGLALPRSARAAILPSAVRPASSPDALAAIRAVLDRPADGWFDATGYACQCARCQALRRQVWECTECGYEGPWLVAGCDCRETRASNLAFCRSQLAAIDAGTAVVRPGDFTREHYLQAIAEDEARPDGRCQAHPDHAVRLARHPHCSHGQMFCPTCGNDGDGCPMDTPDELLAKLREVRRVLRASVA